MQAAAARALYILAGYSQNRDAIIAAQAVPALVASLRSGGLAVQAWAAGALKSLANGFQPSKDAIIAADTLPGLVALLGSSHLSVQEKVAQALLNLAADSR